MGILEAVSDDDPTVAGAIETSLQQLLHVVVLLRQVRTIGAITGIIAFLEQPSRSRLAFEGLNSSNDEAPNNYFCCDLLVFLEILDHGPQSGDFFILE